MPARQLAVALRVVGTHAHVSQALDAHERLEGPRDEQRTVVADDPRHHARGLFRPALDDRFDFPLLHRFPQFPVHDGAAEAVEQRAEEEEGPAHVDVDDVDVPVFVRL